jgi:hypothetical protein
LLPNVLYYGRRKSPGAATAGGAYFKFIPTTPFTGSSAIANLGQSPLAAGSVFGLRLGKNGTSPGTDNGQGTNSGLGTWIAVSNANNANLRAAAATLHLTGFYRPEDAESDPSVYAWPGAFLWKQHGQ